MKERPASAEQPSVKAGESGDTQQSTSQQQEPPDLPGSEADSLDRASQLHDAGNVKVNAH